eukprot:2591032-Rhodomonas_salina.3
MLRSQARAMALALLESWGGGSVARSSPPESEDESSSLMSSTAERRPPAGRRTWLSQFLAMALAFGPISPANSP